MTIDKQDSISGRTFSFKKYSKGAQYSLGKYSVDAGFQELPLLNGRQSNKYFKWGDDNKYPLWIANIAKLFPAESILRGTIDMIAAKFENIDKRVISDYVIYGNAFQTNAGEYLPAMATRVGIEGGAYVDTEFYYTRTAAKLQHISGFKHLRFDASPYAYSAPYWSAIIKDLLVIARGTNFSFNVFDNEFGASGIVNILNSMGLAPTEKERIKNNINNHFTGSTNGAKYFVAFSDDEKKNITFDAITTDINLTRKYDTMHVMSRENVYAGFRCYPQLFGIKLQDSFINDEDYQKMEAMYNKLVITPIAERLSDWLGVPLKADIIEKDIEIIERKASLYDKFKGFFKGN